MRSSPISVIWFRRDLRLDDNAALHAALKSGRPVLPLFIFDQNILEKLTNRRDRRVEFIHSALSAMNANLEETGRSLWVRQGTPIEVWRELLKEFTVAEVFANRDYEPYALDRDRAVGRLLHDQGAKLSLFKDQVIFDQNEVCKEDETPYVVFTPYKRRWLDRLAKLDWPSFKVTSKLLENFIEKKSAFLSLEDLGFAARGERFPPKTVKTKLLDQYADCRDLPALDATTHLGVHLRFGTLSVRDAVRAAQAHSAVWLSELIWREFFMMILWHFPHTVDQAFRPEYDKIPWRKADEEFSRWCQGQTGFPLVDAGMRELETTGYMHNRVRMLVASFLCKHLLIDWRRGERYFADKLLDFELSSNVGNWQWVSGSGCDAAPYFRIFNPDIQLRKFDPELTYVKRWVPEYGAPTYPKPMVDHAEARERALRTYARAVKS